jgi:hypothetical protein
MREEKSDVTTLPTIVVYADKESEGVEAENVSEGLDSTNKCSTCGFQCA